MENATSRNNICILGDASFDDSQIFEMVMAQEHIHCLTHDAKGALSAVVDEYVRRHNYPPCDLVDCTKVVVFYGGEDITLIDRMKKAEKRGLKVKIVKYKLF